MDQLSGKLREPLECALCPTIGHDDVLALDIAKVAEPLVECLDIDSHRRATRTEYANPVYRRRRLRFSGERRYKEREDKRCNEPDSMAWHGALLLSTQHPW
jgi:hypothetical protein